MESVGGRAANTAPMVSTNLFALIADVTDKPKIGRVTSFAAFCGNIGGFPQTNSATTGTATAIIAFNRQHPQVRPTLSSTLL